ncbi:hypothetical protein HPB52_008277 [Rhipicephalus sanguineus]|uniref:Uncharacterized protein n=1 Tax=Rhipicephalus sanguineus TaxID=34632 RepID=A0A9D4SQH6_RHISA|nr:hypothetical protein HPB52_008277 [Rhipicephalus sanguineus]
METFLGGRSLPEAALTVSVLASVVNAVSVVGFLGHYYAYGFHALLPVSATPLAALVTSTALVPLLYNMRAASVFQGAAWACLLVCVLQLWHAIGRGLSAIPPPPVIQGTMDRCPLVTNATESPDPVETTTAAK